MEKLEEAGHRIKVDEPALLPVSVIVPVRNEGHNLARCLESLRRMGEVYVVDSNSTDSTAEIARSQGGKLVQFHYHGGWPKKRQWAMDTLPLAFDWILLIDADEALTPDLEREIQQAILKPDLNGFYIALQMIFLGRALRHCGASFYRLKDQSISMCDMEVHEHVVVDGATGSLKNPLCHHNVESLSRYIQKHDEYSNWEAGVWMQGEGGDLAPALFGSQAQRRRWLRKQFFTLPGSPLVFFLYKYVFCLGFLDGVPGLIYCLFQGVQFFHIKAKIYQLRASKKS